MGIQMSLLLKLSGFNLKRERFIDLKENLRLWKIAMHKGILCSTLMLIFMVSIPVVSAEYSGEVEYSIGDSIFDIELNGDESWTNDDASDLLCWIDENHGNNDGITCLLKTKKKVMKHLLKRWLELK